MKKLLFFVVLLLTPYVFASTINIVAAENFYGSLAQEIGGTNVTVTSIISNPDADPHLFATTVATSRAISNAQIIIYNGNGYDGWMDQILKAKSSETHIINVSTLIKANGNPHIWYDPATFPALAKNLTKLFITLDAPHQKQYQQNLADFLKQNQLVQNKIKQLKARYINTPVIATEPVFGYMANALGLNMQGLDFQWKIMNNTDPTPKMLASYEALITGKKVAVLFYNNQVTDPITKNILALAKANNLAIVGVSETMPQNITPNEWLMAELNNTQIALLHSSGVSK